MQRLHNHPAYCTISELCSSTSPWTCAFEFSKSMNTLRDLQQKLNILLVAIWLPSIPNICVMQDKLKWEIVLHFPFAIEEVALLWSGIVPNLSEPHTHVTLNVLQSWALNNMKKLNKNQHDAFVLCITYILMRCISSPSTPKRTLAWAPNITQSSSNSTYFLNI